MSHSYRMESPINLQDEPGKIVGRRRTLSDPWRTAMHLQELAVELRLASRQPLMPKGVHRFLTHEEADTWLWKTISRPASIPG